MAVSQEAIKTPEEDGIIFNRESLEEKRLLSEEMLAQARFNVSIVERSFKGKDKKPKLLVTAASDSSSFAPLRCLFDMTDEVLSEVQEMPSHERTGLTVESIRRFGITPTVKAFVDNRGELRQATFQLTQGKMEHAVVHGEGEEGVWGPEHTHNASVVYRPVGKGGVTVAEEVSDNKNLVKVTAIDWMKGNGIDSDGWRIITCMADKKGNVVSPKKEEFVSGPAPAYKVRYGQKHSIRTRSDVEMHTLRSTLGHADAEDRAVKRGKRRERQRRRGGAGSRFPETSADPFGHI